jgi:hypothetical protein
MAYGIYLESMPLEFPKTIEKIDTLLLLFFISEENNTLHLPGSKQPEVILHSLCLLFCPVEYTWHH